MCAWDGDGVLGWGGVGEARLKEERRVGKRETKREKTHEEVDVDTRRSAPQGGKNQIGNVCVCVCVFVCGWGKGELQA